MVFNVSRPARFLFRFWILLVGCFAVLTFLIHDIESYLRAIYIPFFLLAFTQWPWAVVVHREGVSKRSCYGLRNTIPWAEVTAPTFDRNSGRITVVGKPGQTIRCSPYLVSPATFRLEMYKHATALGPMPIRESLE
jgi:hypothetical protein